MVYNLLYYINISTHKGDNRMLKTKIKKEIDTNCSNVAIFCDYDNLFFKFFI